jgi:hypothetical protein
VNKEQKAAFHIAVIDALTAQGTPVTTGRTTYGWEARDYAELCMHMAGCRPDYAASTWDDSTWTEWMGTFEPLDSRTGIDLVLTCACGTVRERRWRYTDGYAELIRAITEGD